MSAPGPPTAQLVSDLVMANRAIRSPRYHAEQTGLRWGDDIIPALVGLFHIENDPRGDHSNSWVGFARHWQGGTFRIAFHLAELEGSDEILVVSAVSARDERENDRAIVDEDLGEIELLDQVHRKNGRNRVDATRPFGGTILPMERQR